MRYGCSARTCGWPWRPSPECAPGGQVATRDTREAGAHLNYAAATLGADEPTRSFAVIISPHDDVHPAAARVADPTSTSPRPR